MLDPATGNYLDLGPFLPDRAELDRFAAELTGRPDAVAGVDTVVTWGTPTAMAALAGNARRGAGEADRRRARRRQQRDSRRRNR